MIFKDSKLVISNIKVSVRILAAKSDLDRWCELEASKISTSFFTVKAQGLVFTVFYKGHVNITSCKKQN